MFTTQIMAAPEIAYSLEKILILSKVSDKVHSI